MSSLLFSPLQMRGATFSNRVVVSPMVQFSAVDGCATHWHLMHIGNLAVSGPGAVILEATAISPNGRVSPKDLGLWSSRQAEALAPVVAFCREHSDVKIGLQLWHAGRKGSVAVAWEGNQPIPPEKGGWTVFGASESPYPGRLKPVALTQDLINEVIGEFVTATLLANELGIDFIEVHAAHGYLIHNFLSPLTNQRSDAYGGPLRNRLRFALETFKAVRDAWPAEKPIGVRISATDWVEGGWTIADSVVLAQELLALGCDYITPSSGGLVPEQKVQLGPGYQVPFATQIRREAGIRTMAVGLITEARQAEHILAADQADLVALGRAFLYNPRWAWNAALELGEEPTFPRQYERAHPSMRSGDFFKARRER